MSTYEEVVWKFFCSFKLGRSRLQFCSVAIRIRCSTSFHRRCSIIINSKVSSKKCDICLLLDSYYNLHRGPPFIFTALSMKASFQLVSCLQKTWITWNALCYTFKHVVQFQNQNKETLLKFLTASFQILSYEEFSLTIFSILFNRMQFMHLEV